MLYGRERVYPSYFPYTIFKKKRVNFLKNIVLNLVTIYIKSIHFFNVFRNLFQLLFDSRDFFVYFVIFCSYFIN